MANEQVNSSHVTESQLRLIAAKSARRLGYATLKDEQLQAIVTFALGNYCFIVLPTRAGYGKSGLAMRDYQRAAAGIALLSRNFVHAVAFSFLNLRVEIDNTSNKSYPYSAPNTQFSHETTIVQNT